jgi:outer membrane protein TolC
LERYVGRADREIGCLVNEAGNDPRWNLPNFTVAQDPRSRYYDPYNEIRAPMPKDDPASHRYMRCVDGKRGWARWYENGCRAGLENPNWRRQLAQYVPIDEQGRVKLSIDSAMQLALVNSPDLQTQLETIYLSALDVSTERFRFDVQFFGGNLTRFTHLGPARTGGDVDQVVSGENNTLRTDTDFEIRRRFATAGELVVGFANSFVWQFAGPNSESAISIIDFTLAQPLLRGAGRAVALEQLSLSERTLLANLRAYRQYQQGFYTDVAIGELGVSGPERAGGFFGGTGLTGFTGTGSGGFGGVGEATNFGFAIRGGGTGGGTTAGFAGGGAGSVGGFIGLLQSLQEIRNSQENLAASLRALRLLEAHLEAGTIDLQQVDQFRQSIETERATLLQATNALQDSLDSFKTGTLGLSPDLPIVLDDQLIQQFQFIDPSMSALQGKLSDFREVFGGLPVEPRPERLQFAVEEIGRLHTSAEGQLDAVDRDLKTLRTNAGRRIQAMTVDESKTFQGEIDRLSETFEDLKRRLAATGTSLDRLRMSLGGAPRRMSADQLAVIATEIAQVIDEASLVQARARLEVVTISPVKLGPGVALSIARSNRLDWMNNRAALVDSWRLIAFNANTLLSDLDVVFDGDLQTTGNHPFKFSGSTGRLSVGVEFDGPFARREERNTFRSVLIDYQRDRRQLIQYEDSVYQTLRGLLRQLEELRLNLEIQRRAVAIAIRRVDQTREVLNEPPEGEDTELGPTASLNLISALSDLRSAQDNFMSVWLNYLATRMTLMRGLGIMIIDARGMWVDLPLNEVIAQQPPPEEIPLPPSVPNEWWRKLEVVGPGEPALEPTPVSPSD